MTFDLCCIPYCNIMMLDDVESSLRKVRFLSQHLATVLDVG